MGASGVVAAGYRVGETVCKRGEANAGQAAVEAAGDDWSLVLQLPEAMLCGVLDLLDGRSLLCAGAACRSLRRAVWDAPDGSSLHRWRRLCEEELGEAICAHHAVFEQCIRDQEHEAREEAKAQGQEREFRPAGPSPSACGQSGEEGDHGEGRGCAQSDAMCTSPGGAWLGGSATEGTSMQRGEEGASTSLDHRHEQSLWQGRGDAEGQMLQERGTGARAKEFPVPGISGARFWGHLWGSLLLGSQCGRDGTNTGAGKLTMHWWPMGRNLIASSASTSGTVGQPPSQEQALPSEPHKRHAPDRDAPDLTATGARSVAGREQCLGGEPLKTMPASLESLSRTGHTSTQVGTWQVVIGGLTKAGTAVMDVLVIDNATLRMWKPQLTCACGTPPPRPRFRQTVAVIRCPNHTNTQHHQHMRTSIVDATTSLVPGSNKPGNAWTSQEGALVLFMFGGYTLEGTVYGPEDAYTLTLSADGMRGEWCRVACSGSPPSGRFHHTMVAFGPPGGRQVLVFGGEGPEVDDVLTAAEQEEAILARAREQSQATALGRGGKDKWEGTREGQGAAHTKEEPIAASCSVSEVVYVMDCLTFTWQRVVTFGPGPGFRLLHVSTLHRCRRRGRERFVVVGGFSRAQGAVHAEEAPTVQELQSLRPYALDLRTYQWDVGPLPEGGEEALPKSRHRACHCLIGDGRMLLMEGARGSTRDYLEDAHLLDLTTLQWSVVDVKGRPSDGPSAGQSLESCIVVGGCIIGTLGIKVTPRLDVLVLGDWPEQFVSYTGWLQQRRGMNNKASAFMPEWTGAEPCPTDGSSLHVTGVVAGPSGAAPVDVKKAKEAVVHSVGQASKKQRGHGWVAPQDGRDRALGVAAGDGNAGEEEEDQYVGQEAEASNELTLNLVAKINQVRSTLQGGSDGGPEGK